MEGRAAATAVTIDRDELDAIKAKISNLEDVVGSLVRGVRAGVEDEGAPLYWLAFALRCAVRELDGGAVDW